MGIRTLADVVSHSPEETVRFGRDLARKLEPPCLVLLEGELGTGKTTLVKGIAAGLGAAREEDVNSPTFTLVHEYRGLRPEAPLDFARPSSLARGPDPATAGRTGGTDPALRDEVGHVASSDAPMPAVASKVYHVDLYRIEDARELGTLGLDDLMAQPATVIVEWGEKLGDPGPGPWVRVRLEHLGVEDRRIIVERQEF